MLNNIQQKWVDARFGGNAVLVSEDILTVFTDLTDIEIATLSSWRNVPAVMVVGSDGAYPLIRCECGKQFEPHHCFCTHCQCPMDEVVTSHPEFGFRDHIWVCPICSRYGDSHSVQLY